MNSSTDRFTLRAGRASDAPAIAALLRSTGGRCLAESEDWIRARAGRYRLAFTSDGALAASAALLPEDGDGLVLRSVAVGLGHRGNGLARRLLASLLETPLAERSRVWCRTTTPRLFEAFGFTRVGASPGFDGRPRFRMERTAPRIADRAADADLVLPWPALGARAPRLTPSPPPATLPTRRTE